MTCQIIKWVIKLSLAKSHQCILKIGNYLICAQQLLDSVCKKCPGADLEACTNLIQFSL